MKRTSPWPPSTLRSRLSLNTRGMCTESTGACKGLCQRFCALFLEICTPSLFSPSHLCSGIFRTKQAQNLWHQSFTGPLYNSLWLVVIELWSMWHMFWIKNILTAKDKNRLVLVLMDVWWLRGITLYVSSLKCHRDFEQSNNLFSSFAFITVWSISPWSIHQLPRSQCKISNYVFFLSYIVLIKN